MRQRVTCWAAASWALLAAVGTPAHAAATWRLQQPPPPAGIQFATPVGPVGDIQFFAPNRGLLAIEGNTSVPMGMMVFDGQGWHQLSTVCGSDADHMRIAWAGPAEFWTIAQPSPPRGGPGAGSGGNGLSVCHFKDGAVAGSYSTASSADPYLELDAAACLSPSDCWFGGEAGQDGFGSRLGGFHLHWDGSSLTSVYAPQGRAVADAAVVGDSIVEAVGVSGDLNTRVFRSPILAAPEPEPKLLHRIRAGVFTNEAFALPGDPVVDLLAIDGDGPHAWAVGGAGRVPSDSGADVFSDAPAVAAYYDGAGWRRVPLDGAALAPHDRLVDVAAVPGTDTAWAVVRAATGENGASPRARVIQLTPAGASPVQQVPVTGTTRGAGSKLDCVAVDDCWLATTQGWIFHLTDGRAYPALDDPAFAGTITTRPNEAIEQFIPDPPPADDSLKFAPPPVELPPPETGEEPPQQTCKPIPALIASPRSRLDGTRARNRRRSAFTLQVTFRLRRPAKVGLIATRKGRTVARAKAVTLEPGKRKLSVRVTRTRFPTKLRLTHAELRKPKCTLQSDDDTGVVTSSLEPPR